MGSHTTHTNLPSGLHGWVAPEFEAVARAFAAQLPQADGDGVARVGGGSLALFHRGVCVADLWGGIRNVNGQPWESDTLVSAFSTSKGIASTLLHLLVDQGRLDYSDPVARYWPEFAAEGKGRISVRTLLSHEAGLYPIRDYVADASEMLDWEHMVRVLAAARPAHRPGAKHGYHALTYGFLVGGLIEKVTGEPLAQVLDRELTQPLDLDGAFYGLPESQAHRMADLQLWHREETSSPLATARGMALAQVGRLAATLEGQHFTRAMLPRGISNVDWNSMPVRASCNPSATGVYTARSLAKIYAMIAERGTFEGRRYLSPSTVARMGKVQNRTPDLVLKFPMNWRLGYHRVSSFAPAAPAAFGHFGYGGSGGWADPSRRLAMALGVNSGTGSPLGDLRIVRLSKVAMQIADRLPNN